MKDVEDGAARQKKNRKATKKIHGCSDEGLAEDAMANPKGTNKKKKIVFKNLFFNPKVSSM